MLRGRRPQIFTRLLMAYVTLLLLHAHAVDLQRTMCTERSAYRSLRQAALLPSPPYLGMPRRTASSTISRYASRQRSNTTSLGAPPPAQHACAAHTGSTLKRERERKEEREGGRMVKGLQEGERGASGERKSGGGSRAGEQ